MTEDEMKNGEGKWKFKAAFDERTENMLAERDHFGIPSTYGFTVHVFLFWTHVFTLFPGLLLPKTCYCSAAFENYYDDDDASALVDFTITQKNIRLLRNMMLQTLSWVFLHRNNSVEMYGSASFRNQRRGRKKKLSYARRIFHPFFPLLHVAIWRRGIYLGAWGVGSELYSDIDLIYASCWVISRYETAHKNSLLNLSCNIQPVSSSFPCLSIYMVEAPREKDLSCEQREAICSSSNSYTLKQSHML